MAPKVQGVVGSVFGVHPRPHGVRGGCARTHVVALAHQLITVFFFFLFRLISRWKYIGCEALICSPEMGRAYWGSSQRA